MRIKSIKLQGFKSFIQEKEIFFQGGMTAIVGPNGCGKSNIVDAVCWVLGEQSPKRLRGRKMEEILFNGTEHFSPAGMARVSLQLVKTDQTFPNPYSHLEELSVERVLFRTGESEYRINKAPVRLKDIVDLFMDTGTSTRAYSIIEQGYISEIINAGPDKLRFFIEGAAGIQKYKARKESAARKMEATKENIRHIEAILFEIKRQMNSLKRQAQKARRYQRIKDEVRTLESSLALRDYRVFVGQEALEKTRQEENEKENTRLLAELRKEEADIEAIKTDLVQLNKEAEQKQQKLWEHIQELNQIENRQLYLNQSFQDLKDKIEENQKQVVLTRGQLQQAEEEREGLGEKILELSKRESWVGEIVKESRAKHEHIVSRETELKEQVEKGKEALFACMTQKAEYHNKQITLQDKEKDLVQREAKNVLEINQLKEENAGLDQKKEALENAVEKGRKERALLGSEKTALEAHQKELQEDFDRLSKELEGLLDALKSKSSRLYSLQQIQENYEGYQEGVKAVMQGRDRQEDRLDGIRGMIADFIETAPEYEMALESALGDRLQCVVVEEQQAGLQAVEYLKTQTLGRGSFIPLHLRGKRQADQAVETPAVSLMDVIKTREGYEEITEHLLGDVVLVPDLQDGINLWKKNGSYNRIVTQEGDLIDPHGIISGGRANGSGGTILKSKREIRELQEAVDHLDEDVRRKREENEQHLRKIRFNEADLERLQQRIYEFDIEILKAEKDVQQVEEHHQRNQQRLKILEAESAIFQKESLEWKEKAEHFSGQEQALADQQSEKEGMLSTWNQDLKALTVERELSREDLGEREVEIQIIRENRSSLESRLTQTEQQIREIQAFLLGKEEECQASQTKLTETKSEIETNEEEIRRLGELRGELEEQLAKRTQTIDRQTACLGEKEERAKDLQKQLEQKRQSQDATQLKMVEIGLKKENLQNQIWQKHRIDIASEEDLEEFEGDEEEAREKLEKLFASIEKMGEINPAAIEEFEELQERHQFYQDQYEDLKNSVESLQRLIHRIRRVTKSRFMEAFDGINKKFQQTFPVLFNGGRAFLELVGDKDPLEAGVNIAAQPPGKKLQNINLFSGGEKTLAALALVLAIYRFKPSPFCVLDEVDAALDDINVVRFNEIIRDISKDAQFILITHNKQTMEVADTLYGITMEAPGVSQVVSVTMQ